MILGDAAVAEGGVDDGGSAQADGDVADACSGLGEVEQVSRMERVEPGTDIDTRAGGSLEVRVAGQRDSVHPHDGLSEAGAVHPVQRHAAPEVRSTEPAPCGACDALPPQRKPVGKSVHVYDVAVRDGARAAV